MDSSKGLIGKSSKDNSNAPLYDNQPIGDEGGYMEQMDYGGGD